MGLRMDDTGLTIRHRNGKLRLAGPGGRRAIEFAVLVANDLAAAVHSCALLTEYDGQFQGSKGKMAIKLVSGEFLGEQTPVIRFTWGRQVVVVHVKMAVPIAVMLRTAISPPSEWLRNEPQRVRAAVEVLNLRA